MRCRPTSEAERKARVPAVVKCDEAHREVSVSQTIAGRTNERAFVYDKVFGPASEQADLYDSAVVPIVDEVLSGYTCAIFAYGQTGTGKTYTMEGGIAGAEKTYVKGGELAADAGVIPRSVKQIFETLEANGTEYSVKVTFLELYNEEITDLLGAEVDDNRRKLALLEDAKGFVTVRGLEDVIVKTPEEIFDVLNRGTAKRRTAETKLNKQSSRSHSVFSVTIHMKESTPEGEELIKVGKLNLVDLAGSENVGRSGAKEGRAREAGEINKSLLTLGRVISALVEKQPHVPYRDSKLTRMLRDSLGGRTKTCIIATVAPSVNCLEETLSTLDYAHRAKNIKNRPEVNQRFTKTTLIKDMNGEIDRLRRDLLATREKNGVYINAARYAEEQEERKKLEESVLALEQEIEAKEEEVGKVQALFEKKGKELDSLMGAHEETVCVLQATQGELCSTAATLAQAEEGLEERDYLIATHERAQEGLLGHAEGVRAELDAAAADVAALFGKVARADGIAGHNADAVERVKAKVLARLDSAGAAASQALEAEAGRCAQLHSKMEETARAHATAAAALRERAAAVATAAAEGAAAVVAAAEAQAVAAKGALEATAAHAAARGDNAAVAARAAAETAAAAAEALGVDLGKHEASLKSFASELSEEVGSDCAEAATEAEAFAAAFEAEAKAEEAELMEGIGVLVASFVGRRAEAVRVASSQHASAVRAVGSGLNCKLSEMMGAAKADAAALRNALDARQAAAKAEAEAAAEADVKAAETARAQLAEAGTAAEEHAAAVGDAKARSEAAVTEAAAAAEGAIVEAEGAVASGLGAMGEVAAAGAVAAEEAAKLAAKGAREAAAPLAAFQLKAVKPTGTTPARRAYAVPREGAAAALATPAPQDVLAQYRVTKGGDAAQAIAAAAAEIGADAAAAEPAAAAETPEQVAPAAESEEVVDVPAQCEESPTVAEEAAEEPAAAALATAKASRLRAPLAAREANA